MTLGDAVRQKRRAAHLTLPALGALLGVNFQRIGRIERHYSRGSWETRQVLCAWVHGLHFDKRLRSPDGPAPEEDI